ncbi:MAG: valine--tRNA ligase [Clostridia bacterium]|nr:valine--tRNA ligase [Clostridia bacterium]
MEKTYNSKECEQRIYKNWVEKGYFHEEPDKSREPFCIVIPPPNITGQLHMGHALDNTMQDILIRFKRMQGFCTLWLPGTDHASIATEVKILEQLAKEGITKDDLTREEFLDKAWEWYKLYGGRIVEQLKRLGSSCDWQRERFTMDEGCSKAVREVFVKLYDKGLIYQGDRIINWCPDCRTALSDAEVEYEEKASHLWHLEYPLTDGSGYIVVATTRPETMLGDTAVAVNPEDDRYKGMVGKTVMLPLMDREIPIIADSYVEMEFGTGAVKITPAHDPNDYLMAERHDIATINIMNEDGTLNSNAGKYAKLPAAEARRKIVEDLKAIDKLVKTEDYTHKVGTCYRCSTTVEPLISKQWFVNMQPLAEPAIKAVEDSDVEFVPERFSKIYFNWMNNIKDWCISRQLWWGHRIPVWYCNDCGHIMVKKDDPSTCDKCSSKNIRQDEDVLDTWFSSALWPFSTLGWPEDTAELEYFYPTNVLVTGYDIIFFWVARMIFSGLEHMGEKPFSHVLIHGLVRDAQGRKMSKSLGNGIDPIDVIEEFGADALRFSVTSNSAPGNDMRFNESKIEAARNFANKIWNAARFVHMNIDGQKPEKINIAETDAADKWILSQLNGVIKEATRNLETFELGLALQKVYDFIWSEFCDWYIELSKAKLYEGTESQKKNTTAVLYHVLIESLKLLHPFMPFVTEEIYQNLEGSDQSIMIDKWPLYDDKMDFEEAAKMELVKDIIHKIRNIRAQMDVPANRRTTIYISPKEGVDLTDSTDYIRRLASGEKVELLQKDSEDSSMVSIVSDAGNIYLPLNELIDFEKEKARVQGEIELTKSEIARAEGMLKNEKFVAKAPENVVQKERDNLANNREKLTQLESSLEKLEN